MSTPSVTTNPSSAGASSDAAHFRVGLRGLTWMAWRQHRWLLVVTGGLVGMEITALAWVNHQLPAGPCPGDGPCREAVNRYLPWAQNLLWLSLLLPGVVAVFWGAPLLAREYEQRTHLLAWSQDVPPGRWFLSRIGLLAIASAALAALLVPAVRLVLDNPSIQRSGDGFNDGWDTHWYESTALLAVAYTLGGLAIGVVASALLRRVVPTMAVTLAAFVGIRFVLQEVRPWLLPPLRRFAPLDDDAPVTPIGPNALRLGGWYVDVDGRDVAAIGCRPGLDTDLDACLREAGIAGSIDVYQPASRINVLRLIEAGIFVAVAALCVLATWYVVTRRRSPA